MSIIICRQIATAYIGATTGAVFASVGLNSLLAVRNKMVSKYHPRGTNLVTESASIAEAMGTIWSSSCSQLCQYPHHETKVISNNNTTPLLHCIIGSSSMG